MPAADQGVSASVHRYHLVPRVLCFVFAAGEVLLIKGAPDKRIWPGKYNALGGHVERGETVLAAAQREITEEAGLAVTELRLRGVITIDTAEPAGIGLFVFTALARDRTVRPSAEGALEWLPVALVGGRDCVEDLPILLSRLASMDTGAPPFSAHYAYDATGNLLVSFD
jgi:8-oxo-dGTP diphosphatase